ESRPGLWVIDGGSPRALNALGMMYPRDRSGLLGELRICKAAAVGERRRHNLTLTAFTDIIEGYQAYIQYLCMIHRNHMMHEYTYGTKAQPFHESHFFFHGLRIKGGLLPHFKLISSGSGHIIHAYGPLLLLIPVIGPLFRPSGSLLSGSDGNGQSYHQRCYQT